MFVLYLHPHFVGIPYSPYTDPKSDHSPRGVSLKRFLRRGTDGNKVSITLRPFRPTTPLSLYSPEETLLQTSLLLSDKSTPSHSSLVYLTLTGRTFLTLSGSCWGGNRSLQRTIGRTLNEPLTENPLLKVHYNSPLPFSNETH